VRQEETTRPMTLDLFQGEGEVLDRKGGDEVDGEVAVMGGRG